MIVLLFFIPMLAFGDEPPFYSVGPGGGGAIIYATINPQDGNNITLSCDMSSTFISTDGVEHFKSYRFWDYSRYDYNPHDANIIYAYHRQQVYISHDKGVTFDYFAPNADVIEKVGHNMQLSNAQNGTSKVIYKRQNGQMAHLVTTSPSNIDGYRIKKVYVHPTDPQTIYVFFDGTTNLPLGISRSTDGGETWYDFARGFAGNLNALGNARYGNTVLSTIQRDGTYLPHGDNDNNNFGDYVDMVIVDDKLVAMGNEGIYVFDQDGEVIEQHPIKNRFGQFAVSGNDLTIYITSENGFEIQKSADFGATWTKVVGGNTLAEESDFYERLTLQNGMPANNVRHQHYFRALQVVGNSIYVSFNSDRGYPASWDSNYLDWVQNVNTAGVAVSHDAGETWLWSFESTYFMRKDYITSGSVAEMNNGIRTTFAIAVNKGNPNQAIITNHYSAFQTLDGGLTWKSMESNTVKEEDGRAFYTTRGIEPAGQHAFAADPSNANHQYSGWTDIGLWESFDGGKSWAKVTFSADFRSTNAWGVTFNPDNPDIILASNVNSNRYKGDGGEYLPETVLDVIYGETSVSSIRGRIMRSVDGGKTWAEAAINEVAGYPDTDLKILPTAIVFDPVNENTAYFSSNGLGVFRSTDAGATWSIMNDGLEMQESAGRYGIGAHELTLGTDQKTLFVHTARSASADFKRFGDTYYLDLTTGSTTWTKLNRPNDTKSSYYDEGTWIFSIDRAPDGTLYAGTSVRKQVNDAGSDKYLIDGECGGAYVSTDMGATWRQIYNEIQSVYAVKIDSRNPSNLYISAMGNILMSTKGENTTLDDWVEIAEIPHRQPWKIYEDPNNKNRIIANTNCGGTWSMAVPNDPDTPEENDPPTITTHPQSQTLTEGQTLTLSVEATGTDLSYQWLKDGTPIDGATTASYTKTDVQTTDSGIYTCIVTNTEGSVTSDEAIITVNVAVIPVTGVSLGLSEKIMSPGETFQLTATIIPANATETGVTWMSSNTAVVTVSSTGLMTAIAAGTAQVTVTTLDGDFTDEVTVIVEQEPVPEYTVTIASNPVEGGTVSPYGAVIVQEGESVTITITPNQDYMIETITLDGVEMEAANSLTLNDVRANHSVVVTFRYDPVANEEVTSSSLKVFALGNGSLKLEAAGGIGKVSLYSPSGTLVRAIQLDVKEAVIIGLSRGVYIVEPPDGKAVKVWVY